MWWTKLNTVKSYELQLSASSYHFSILLVIIDDISRDLFEVVLRNRRHDLVDKILKGS